MAEPDWVIPEDGRTMWERFCASEPHIAAQEPRIADSCRRAAQLTARFNELWAHDERGAQQLLRELLGGLGEGVTIRGPITVDHGRFITIGDGTFINFNLTALDMGPITIGRNVQIGPDVQLLTPTHPLDPDLRRTGIEGGLPIVIGDDVWLGGGVIVTPGTRIGPGSVVGAGSVVVRDVPARSLAAGNPARVVRSLSR